MSGIATWPWNRPQLTLTAFCCEDWFHFHWQIYSIQLFENLHLWSAMTSALGGRGLLTMFSGTCGTVTVALLSCSFKHFLSTVASSIGLRWQLLVFSNMGFATHSLVVFETPPCIAVPLGWHPWIQWLVTHQCWLPTEFEQPCHYRSAAVRVHICLGAYYDIP